LRALSNIIYMPNIAIYNLYDNFKFDILSCFNRNFFIQQIELCMFKIIGITCQAYVFLNNPLFSALLCLFILSTNKRSFSNGCFEVSIFLHGKITVQYWNAKAVAKWFYSSCALWWAFNILINGCSECGWCHIFLGREFFER